MKDLKNILVSSRQSINEVIASIDRNGKGIALVVDDKGCLTGTITDGDIRRAILANTDLNLPIQRLLERRKAPVQLNAPVGTAASKLVSLMQQHSIRHIPLIDSEGRVVELALLGELQKEGPLGITAIVMAGGFGKRLMPLTEDVPKPMLPVGDRPLLERIVEQLRDAGIDRMSLATHYKEEVISKHFGDGREFGVQIDYVREDEPLGTAGALSRLGESKEPLLVMNGDVLSRIDFRAMLDYHMEQKADMTVAVRVYELRIPYGVIKIDEEIVQGVEEKPFIGRYFINAGIYLLNPEVRNFVPADTRFDMTDLIGKLIAAKRRVVSFPVREYWLDIGKIEDYQKAKEDSQKGAV
jgi:dTDP-glucose pyrophosphorylase